MNAAQLQRILFAVVIMAKYMNPHLQLLEKILPSDFEGIVKEYGKVR